MTNDKKPRREPKDLTGDADHDDDELYEDEDGELKPGPMERLEIEIADLKDRYIRLAAEMENLRKRTERERADIKKYAVSEFARDILPLSDNFQRAIEAVPSNAAEQDETLKGFLEGVKMNERELQKVLERHGVTQLDPKGEKFDPNMHQAVQQIENAELPNNTVCDVYQVGYIIADRVLRPAVVSVAKGGPKEVPAAPEPSDEKKQATETKPVEPEGNNTDIPSGETGANVDKSA